MMVLTAMKSKSTAAAAAAAASKTTTATADEDVRPKTTLSASETRRTVSVRESSSLSSPRKSKSAKAKPSKPSKSKKSRAHRTSYAVAHSVFSGATAATDSVSSVVTPTTSDDVGRVPVAVVSTTVPPVVVATPWIGVGGNDAAVARSANADADAKAEEDDSVTRAVAMIARANALRDSSVVTEESVRRLPALKPDEVTLGERLGRGGFYDVFEVARVELRNDDDADDANETTKSGGEARRAVAAACRLRREDPRTQTKKTKKKKKKPSTANVSDDGDHQEVGRYAVKCMRRDVVENRNRYLTAVKDIVTETHLLSSLDHPNIARVRAVVRCDDVRRLEGSATITAITANNAAASLDDVLRSTGQDAGFVLVLDRLFGTLRDKTDGWRADAARSAANPFARRRRARAAWLRERLPVVSGLAEAVAHLHGLGVLYRDLKPENVGFDERGAVRLFDFGLAREVRAAPRAYDDDDDGSYRYRLSVVGTPRYMAPEVLRGEPYDGAADAYSFGVVLWETLTLRKAFEGWPFARLRNRARSGRSDAAVVGLPPPSSDQGTFATRRLAADCCSFDHRARPTFAEIAAVLRAETDRVRAD